MTLGNRAIQTTPSSSTGDYTLDPIAVPGYQTLKAALIEITGDAVGPWTVDYAISDDTDSELGIGTLTDGSPGSDTLARTTVLSSTNGDAAVDWGTNTKTVRISPSAQYHATLPGATAESELTISGGSVTPRFATHSVDTEADAASDDLTNIATTYLRDGRLLLIRANNDARTVVAKHAATGAGQLHLATDADFSLDADDKWLLLIRRGADWYEVARNYGADAAAERAKLGLVIGTDVQAYDANYLKIPQNAQTAAYELVVGDLGKFINITTGGVTVPASVFAVGDVVSVYNNSGSAQTITQGASATMYLAGTATTGNRTLAQRGIATILCVAADTFVINGGGLT